MKKETKRVSLSAGVYNNIIRTLSQLPYGEVVGLLNYIQQDVQPVKTEEVEAVKPVDKKEGKKDASNNKKRG
jgi:hypothetical protein